MANVKFSQFTSETPSVDSFFVGYNNNTNVNTRFSLAQLSTALGLSGYVTLATTQTISGSKRFSSSLLIGSAPSVTVTSDINLYSTSDSLSRWVFNSGTSNVLKAISFRAGDLTRWELHVEGAESGGNSGQNLHFVRFDDAGNQIENALNINRSTGHVRVYQDLRLDGDLILNAGAMTITNAQLQYLDGLSSNLQTQLNGKEPTITAGTASQFWKGNKSWATLVAGDIPSLDASKITTGTITPSLLPKITRAVSMAAGAVSNGNNTNEEVLQTLTIPANTLSVGDILKVGYLFSFNPSGSTKTVRLRQTDINGTSLPTAGTSISSSNAALQTEFIATVTDSTTLRFGATSNAGGYGTSTVAAISLTIDLTQPIVFVVTGQKAASGNTCTCETAYVILIS
jgi:hypothetical protein